MVEQHTNGRFQVDKNYSCYEMVIYGIFFVETL